MSGPGIQIASAKAPWVMFDRRAEEDRNASIAAGRFVAKDVDYVLITPHGSKDQIERVAAEWFEYLKEQVQQGRFEGDWLSQYRRAYDSWKEGKEIPLNGTPIINWPLVSPAQARALTDLHILTVEVLAEANEEVVARLGMGGRSLRDKAKAFMAQANGPGKVAEELASLKVKVESGNAVAKALTEQNELLRAQVTAMQSGLPQGEVVRHEVPDVQSAVGISDLLDDEPNPKMRKL